MVKTILTIVNKLLLLAKTRQLVIGLSTRIITGTREITTIKKESSNNRKIMMVEGKTSVRGTKTKIMIKVINKITL